MSGTIETRLNEMGITLPSAAAPAANYVPFHIFNRQLFISGQLSMIAGAANFTGKLGADMDIETGQQAAKVCAINILAQAKAALGELDRIEQCLHLGAFVNAASDFTDHPEVVNGASDFLVEVFGDKGRHTRFAVGAGSLPRGVAVEIASLFAIE